MDFKDQELMNRLVEGLNDAQLEAVTRSYHTNTLVIAGAGSGKTSVLSRRICYILANGYSPQHILSLTFTNKAAEEMRKRVTEYCSREVANQIMMGTFHSISVRFLRRFGEDIGIPQSFVIYDTKDAKHLIKESLFHLTQDDSKEVVERCVAYIECMKNRLITPEEAYQHAHTDDLFLYANVYTQYEYRLKKNKALDFNSLIMQMVFLLRESVRMQQYCHQRFKYILVDECQDTNKAQFELLERLAGHNNIFLVGDDAQSIYGWRGAEVKHMINFQETYPDSHIIKLEQNYRSTQTIVNAGNAIIKNNTVRLDKTCYSHKPIGEPIAIYQADDAKNEAHFIISEILLRKEKGVDLKDIAILCRVNKLTRQLEDECIDKGVHYQIYNGVSFYQRKEIKDVLSYLKAASNPSDDKAMERVLQLTPKIGKKTIHELKELGHTNNVPLIEAIKSYDGRSRAHLEKCLKLLVRLSKMTTSPMTHLIETVLELTGYMKRLKASNTQENMERIENIEELLSIASAYESSDAIQRLDYFLDRMTLSSDSDTQATDDCINIMTVHSSKGLEFDTVFVMGLEENLFPHKNAKTEFELEEERRAFYVACTRAKDKLYLTYANKRMYFGNTHKCYISRFIQEIPHYLVELKESEDDMDLYEDFVNGELAEDKCPVCDGIGVLVDESTYQLCNACSGTGVLN